MKKAAEMTWKELGRYIDQSVLKPEFSQEEVKKYILEGIYFNCRTVCINPSSLPLAIELCEGTNTDISVVCDFPFGKSSTESKCKQAEIICSTGKVIELDVVSNYGYARSGAWEDFYNDIKAVVDVCHKYGVESKIILETDALTHEEIKKAAEVAASTGTDFIKSSTGFLTGHEAIGASNEVVDIMMEAAKGKCKVKGSGAIRTREHFLELVDKGIDRMGIGFKSTPIVLDISVEDAKKEMGY